MKTRLLILAGALLVFGLVNGRIVSKERLRTGGEAVFLELAPVDPRSLMQGDYMALNFQIARQIAAQSSAANSNAGIAILQLDQRRIAHFLRLDSGQPLNQPLDQPLKPGEVRFRYRYRGDNVWLGTNAFFFEEGSSERYRTAKYGEFRVNSDGEAMLVNLRGPNLELF
jgi:uncharacterized membrane-anchored protein